VDSWFGKAVDNFPVEEILSEYHADKLLRDTNGLYHLVNIVPEAEVLEYTLKKTTI
jgi:hypothetical protein